MLESVKARLRAHIRRVVAEEVEAKVAAERARVVASNPTSAEAVEALSARIADLEIALSQTRASAQAEGIVLPVPPKELQVRVVGNYSPRFVESGFSICRDLDNALEPAGRRLADFRRILDWGCGCGRVVRALRSVAPEAALDATDIDPEAIAWLTAHYSRVATFHVAPHRPPMPYANASFDFVYGISVFTHLSEARQFEWLEELRRITKPGAWLVMTISGENNYRLLPPDLIAEVEAKGIVFVDGGYGQSIGLPEFYQNTFHTHGYIEREWSRYFRVVSIEKQRVENHQDTVLLQRA